MTLRELIQQSSFKPVFNSLYRNYYKNFSDDEINQYSLSYSKVYDFLRNLKPTGNLNYKIYISEREEINFKDEEPEKFVDVGLYDEKKDEVLKTIDDMVEHGLHILTIGQYLQPTKMHIEVDDFITPEIFEMYKDEGLKRGLKYVESGPLVRSSYHAERHVNVEI